DGGKLGFEVGGGRERGQRRFGLGTRAGGFIARRGQADAGLFQRRNAGSVASLCLGRSRRAQGGFGGLLELTGGLGLDTGRLQLALDLGEAGALGQTPCRAGRSMSSGGEAI